MGRYLKRYRLLVGLALIASVATSVAAPVSAVLEQKMVDRIVLGDLAGFGQMLRYTALIILLTAGAYFLEAMAVNRCKSRIARDMRSDLYDSLMRRGLVSFAKQDTAQYISMINNDISTVSSNFTSPVFTLVGMAFSTVFSLAVMFWYSPLLAGAAVACSLLSFLIPAVLTDRLKKQLVAKTEGAAALSVQMKESFNGHEAVTAFDVFPKIRSRFVDASDAMAGLDYRLDLLISALQHSTTVMGKTIKFITFLLAGAMAIRGRITIGTVLLFVSLYTYFSSGIMAFSQCVPLIHGCRPVVAKLRAIIDERDDTFPGREEPSFQKEIQIKDLSFSYQADIPVLRGLELTIRKNEKLVLTGASGCGKSTFIKLLSGCFGSYTGDILYDGAELHSLDNRKLRKTVTVIHQNTFLFNDSIRFNICLGEEFPEEALHTALVLSGVEKFLPAIPGGIDGPCGENGANLSGGQKQRIALARALIRGIDFLILDEGVSAIDVKTAGEIQQELLRMKDLTLLTITHRIQDRLIQDYDRVLLMQDGKIIEKI